MPKKDSIKRKIWRAKINAWKASDLTVQEWCKQNNTNYHQFRYWRYTLKDSTLPVQFEELKDTVALDIEVHLGQVKIIFPNGCTPQLLSQCIKSLKDFSC